MKQRILALLFFCLFASLFFGFDKKNYFVSIPSYRSYQYFMKGVRLFHEQRYEAASDSFKRSLNYDPADEFVLYWYGKALYKTGKSDEALNVWQNIERMGLADSLLTAKIDRLSSPYIAPSLHEKLSDFIYLKQFSQDENFLKEITQPIDVLVDENEMLYMLDFTDSKLKIFDMNGELQQTISKGEKRFEHPRAIAFDAVGNILVADYGNDMVYKLARDGNLLLSVGGSGYTEGAFYGPSGVASDKDNKIYVADTGNNRVQIFAADGEYLWQFGSLGKEPAQFFRPSGIAIADEMIYVADTGNMRVQRFDIYGNYDRSFTNAPFFHPRYIKNARDGNLFISDEKRIYYFDVSRSLFHAFYRSKQHSYSPMGIAQGSSALYVADFVPGEIDVFIQKEEYYANIEINLERSFTREFPSVVHMVSVRDRKGEPIRGLSAENFSASELNQKIFPVGIYDKAPDLSKYRFIFIIEDSAQAEAYQEAIEDEIKGFVSAFTHDDEALVIHYNDSIAVRGGFENRNLRIQEHAFKFRFKGGSSALGEAIYEGVRRSFRSFRKSAIVVFCAHDINAQSFTRAPYFVTASFAKHNFVPISVVGIGVAEGNPLLEEIAESTYGHFLHASQSIDYTRQMKHLKDVDLGRYYITYDTFEENPTRDKYRPFAVEVHVRDMFGKENAGYIIP